MHFYCGYILSTESNCTILLLQLYNSDGCCIRTPLASSLTIFFDRTIDLLCGYFAACEKSVATGPGRLINVMFLLLVIPWYSDSDGNGGGNNATTQIDWSYHYLSLYFFDGAHVEGLGTRLVISSRQWLTLVMS